MRCIPDNTRFPFAESVPSRKTSLYARASVGQERLGLANRFIVNVSSSLPLPWILLPMKCRRGCGPPSAASDRRPRKVVMQHLDPSNTGKLASCHFVDACCMAFFGESRR